MSYYIECRTKEAERLKRLAAGNYQSFIDARRALARARRALRMKEPLVDIVRSDGKRYIGF